MNPISNRLTTESTKAAEILYVCPRCYQHGFTQRGLKAHNCRGVTLPECRRRLTPEELRAARSYDVSAPSAKSAVKTPEGLS